MEKKIINAKGYDLNLIKTDKFKTTRIDFRFKRKLNKEELVKRSLIADILVESTAKYPSKKEYAIAKEENYGQSIGTQNMNVGNYALFNVYTTYVNPKYIDCKDERQFLDLLMEVVFNPDIDSSFKQEKFDLVLKELKEYMASEKENTSKYALTRAYEAADKYASYTLNNYGYIEDVEGVNKDNLYEYYKDMIENDFLDITVIGDIDFEIYENYFKEKISRKEINNEFDYEYKQTRKKEYIEEKEEYDSFQSKLVMILKTEDMSNVEKKVLIDLYKFIFGSGTNSKLFSNVREKHSLCYSISASTIPVNNCMLIRAGINKKDYEKAKELIIIELDNMKNNITEEEIIAAKKQIINGILLEEESAGSMLSIHLAEKNMGLFSREERIDIIKKATIEDIFSVANKIKLDTIFLLEGGKEWKKYLAK